MGKRGKRKAGYNPDFRVTVSVTKPSLNRNKAQKKVQKKINKKASLGIQGGLKLR
jgi:hypothetical protein